MVSQELERVRREEGHLCVGAVGGGEATTGTEEGWPVSRETRAPVSGMPGELRERPVSLLSSFDEMYVAENVLGNEAHLEWTEEMRAGQRWGSQL